MKSKIFIAIVIFVPLFLILFLLQNESQQEEIVSDVQNFSVSDWQMYRDLQFGFKMKIPQSWQGRVVEPYQPESEDSELHQYGEQVRLDLPLPGGIEFYEMKNGVKSRQFILQAYRDEQNWSLKKFWAIHSSDLTEDDFNGEEFVGDPELYPDGFLYDSCDACDIPFYEYMEEPFYAATASTIVDLNGKIFLKFYKGSGTIVKEIIKTLKLTDPIVKWHSPESRISHVHS